MSSQSSAEVPPRITAHQGVVVKRVFNRGKQHPFESVAWSLRDVSIVGSDGEAVFEQREVEAPEAWSDTACAIVAQKYFHGRLGRPDRESSVRQLITRVVHKLGAWGHEGEYFADEDSAQVFEHELSHLLVHQMGSFNSPVWFNLGAEENPQCSACFINSVEDSMESILTLNTTEGMLFKYGSGAGSNLSAIRGAHEPLAGGGSASGPISFMRGLNSFAGAIKSGGKSRRAAKMVILDVDHPDIREFIACKAEEERKAQALIAAGYSADFDAAGGAYDSVQFQNANHSVRVSDDFMLAARNGARWDLCARTSGEPTASLDARTLLRDMAEAAWTCGDPGVQYDTTINRWNTCPGSGRINASNPCSEFMFLDDTACNLASLNLLRFVDQNGSFMIEDFRHAVGLLILAQEIMVGRARYPSERITTNSHHFRPLGLGFSNLGALLMSLGMAYDSEDGRGCAAAITALMTGEAYRQSALIARVGGPFSAFEVNREPMLDVIRAHRDAARDVEAPDGFSAVKRAAAAAWDQALESGLEHGYRNAQVTVLAPTGTIGLMMDCVTTGIEPELALVKQKRLVGGGCLRQVNATVPRALVRLGYDDDARRDIMEHLASQGTVEGADALRSEDLPVFDCAFKAAGGERFLAPEAHIRMMAAVQPLLSGAISKTVNLPRQTTSDEIERLYVLAWELGLKSLAVYRDGCKGSQPLNAGDGPGQAATQPRPVRRHLPDQRQAVVRKFAVDGHEGYVHVGLFDDGTPGELFIRMSKVGTTLSGMMDAFAIAISMTLQYGVPLEALVKKFAHVRFEPFGWTNFDRIPTAKSIVDFIFRWLALQFMPPETAAAVGVIVDTGTSGETTHGPPLLPPTDGAEPPEFFGCGRLCKDCGAIMRRIGMCDCCLNCGANGGCGG